MSTEQIKPGYKRTEVGVIPEDWVYTPLYNFLSFISYGFTNPMPTVPDGIFMITAADITGGRLQLETARKTSESAYRTLLSSKSKPRQNDILLTKDGTLGRLALTGNETICINQSVAVMRPNERIIPQFLKILLESPYYQKRMVDEAGGSSIKLIYITIVDKMPLGIPLNKSEQSAIAAALSDVDALLAHLDQLIAKKRDLKQAAMQQLLTGQTRLPGFSGEWQAGTLADAILALEAGVSVNSTDEPPDSGIPSVLKTSALTGGVLLPEECKVIETRDLQRARTTLKSDTILLSRMNTPILVGEVAYVDRNYEWLYLPDRVWMTVFKSGSKISARWLAYLLSSRNYRNQLREIATGTSGSMKNISKGALLGLSIQYPEPSEQTAIATVLSDMDTELAALEARRDKTRALKQGMMQELLTGRIRLV